MGDARCPYINEDRREAMSANQEQSLTCVDCGGKFLWTLGEQEYFREKGFTEPPKRCKDCRRVKKAQRDGAGQPQGGKK